MECVIQDRKIDRWIIYGIGIFICIGILARDLMGVGINKYIFLMLAMVPLFFVKLENMVSFMCFIIPLYVGLPGNLISACLLIRLLYEAFRHKILLNGVGFILSYAVAAYILLQNLVTGYMGIYHIMAAMDFVNLYLLMAAVRQYRRSHNVILAFSLGNFVLGIVMLSATLSYYSLSELMNPATRLGDTGMLLRSTGESMATSIDPNFYAMNVIATITTGCLLLSQPMTRRMKTILLASMLGCVICCLIGLSRTFIVLLAIWGILWVICQGNIKRTILFLFVGSVLVFAFFRLMPTVAKGLLDRFSGDDVIGGNGRISLILKYYEPWIADPLSTIFGIGLFNCHTHCAPLLYLFGLGVVGMIPLFGWVVHYWNQCRQYTTKLTLRQCVPAIVTFISFSTIPAAGAVNYTLPILIAMMAVMFENSK